jgi:GH15 family glucan-1,4-alpha-glucosidase
MPAFPPHVLREYALLADGERGVLVGPRGDLAWMCFPRWDSDALFSTLLGGRGVFAVAPRGRCVWGGYYEERSLIWRSRWVTDDGAIVECREALALPTRPDRAVILRRLEACSGEAIVDVRLNPRAGFGAHGLRGLRRDEDGCWRGRTGGVTIAVGGADRAQVAGDGSRGKSLALVLHLTAGETHDLILVLGEGGEELEVPDAEIAWSATAAAWRERVPELQLGVATRDACHSVAILTGLTSAGGGMVAAATTSLPEGADEGRSYDYRYAWIRDQCYAGQAAAAAGLDTLLDDAVGFVSGRLLEDGPDLAPAYTATGARVPDERPIDLPGYPGGGDLVSGNHVNRQFQLDTFGEALLLLAGAARRDRLDSASWRAAELAADAIEGRWREPDAGIWELDAEQWTHSRLISAAGLRAIAACTPDGARSTHLLALADALLAETARTSLHPSGRWQRARHDARHDVSLLLAAVRGAVPTDDPRSQETLRLFVEELTEDGFAYRFRPDERPLGEAEGSFLLAGFIVALAYLQQGDAASATGWFDRNRTACGPPGLLAEEFDVNQRQLRGNLPQAFVHALLLECAARLDAARGA